jgi:hypothetical protein
MSRIICDNGDGFGAAPFDAFTMGSLSDFKPCSQIPGIDLNKWRG